MFQIVLKKKIIKMSKKTFYKYFLASSLKIFNIFIKFKDIFYVL